MIGRNGFDEGADVHEFERSGKQDFSEN